MSGVAVSEYPANATSHERILRLWPAVIIVIAQWVFGKVPNLLWPGEFLSFMFMFYAPIVGGALIIIWWLTLSRARWYDRLLVFGVFVATGVATYFLCDPTFQIGILVYALPIATTAWVAWLVLTTYLRWPVRRIGLLVTIVLAWSYALLLRFDGATGGMDLQISWRWEPTGEEKTLAELKTKETSAPLADAAGQEQTLQAGDWPEFRGPHRDGKVTGVRIATDWNANPPRKVWRQRIGPGWGSFTVIGKRLYTQEQRGEKEVVTCYDAGTGKGIWVHEDDSRFTEAVAGPGPRATPTFTGGKLYTLGANGILNCLDPATGEAKWTRDIAKDSGAKVPQWGFAASPLVFQDIVTVFAGGPEGKAVLGYQATTGDIAWTAGKGSHSYCSLQVAKIGGVDQLLVNSDAGSAAYHPTSGAVLWEHEWDAKSVARIVQPAVLDDDSILIGTGFDLGTRRISLKKEADAWKDASVWTSVAIKPYYNDFVVHQGHLYGFDGLFFTCVNLEDGKGKWRARGYGNGQVLLIADQNLLLVISEKGEVALVEATPSGHKQIAKFQAIEGKTWNHPVIAHGRLYVRNGDEAACYELKEEGK